MSTTVSNATASVLANIAKTFSGSLSSCGDPVPVQAMNSVFTANMSDVPQFVATSGFIAPAGPITGSSLTYTVTTTGSAPNTNVTLLDGWQQAQQNWSGDTIPNSNVYYPPYGMPYIGDPVPNSGSGFTYPPFNPGIGSTPFKIEPKLEDLEEGLHDIPGGKIFIKKIKITEEQLDDAIEEALGHEASPEEKAQIVKEIEELAASEEREV